MTICFKHMEYLHFFINSCVPSLFYTVRIVLVMQSDNVFIILKHACEQATFWSQKVEFQNVLMSMLISIPDQMYFTLWAVSQSPLGGGQATIYYMKEDTQNFYMAPIA